MDITESEQRWRESAYPLKQITLRAQGTRHSEREFLIEYLERALERLKSGDDQGFEHDDDAGYIFEYHENATDSFFNNAGGRG